MLLKVLHEELQRDLMTPGAETLIPSCVTVRLQGVTEKIQVPRSAAEAGQKGHLSDEIMIE